MTPSDLRVLAEDDCFFPNAQLLVEVDQYLLYFDALNLSTLESPQTAC